MEITGPVKCDLAQDFPKSGPEVTAEFSQPVVWLKNIGNTDATGVFESMTAGFAKLVPLKKTGNPHIDDWPIINNSTCQNSIQDPRFMAFPIYAGQEWKFDNMRGATIASKPPLPKDIAVELIWPWCFGYWDEYDIRHATCTTYIFVPDDTGGSQFFTCDKPRTGAFQPALSGHCEN